MAEEREVPGRGQQTIVAGATPEERDPANWPPQALEVLHSVVDKAIQVYGAAGVTEDHPLSMFSRQARLARIYDGPDEVHKMVVARRILARYEGKRTGR
jgi:hypothetical protein